MILDEILTVSIGLIILYFIDYNSFIIIKNHIYLFLVIIGISYYIINKLVIKFIL